jgi:hypothetical protein
MVRSRPTILAGLLVWGSNLYIHLPSFGDGHPNKANLPRGHVRVLAVLRRLVASRGPGVQSKHKPGEIERWEAVHLQQWHRGQRIHQHLLFWQR